MLFFAFGSFLYSDVYAQDQFTVEDAFVLGEYYFNQDDDPSGPYDLDTARLYYELITSTAPGAHELVWYQLGRIDFLEGKFDDALDKFQAQIRYFGDDVPNVYYMLGLTYGYKARQLDDEISWEKAAESFQVFINYVPQAPWPRVDLAWVYFSQGKFQEMIPTLEEGLGYRPDNPWLLNMYGLALMNTNRREEALTQFYRARDTAAQLTPEDWGNAYPGNHPDVWERGLREFTAAIDRNIELSEQ